MVDPIYEMYDMLELTLDLEASNAAAATEGNKSRHAVVRVRIHNIYTSLCI